MIHKREGRAAHKVTVVGTGRVGASFAYTLLLWGLAADIVLVDRDAKRAEGEAMDLGHAVPLASPARIRAGEISDCEGSDIVMVAAGASQRASETRLDLLRRNLDVFRSVIPEIASAAPDAVLLIATNPVDALSYVAWKLSRFPAHRVVGSGTVLDTARFRYLLSEHFGVDARNIHGYVIGEHGDSEVAVWSRTTVAGIPLDDYCRRSDCELTPAQRLRLFLDTRDAAYHVIERKGATYYSIACALARITEAILRNQRSVLSVSARVPEDYGLGDLFLSLPTVIGASGVLRVLEIPLEAKEQEGLRRSAELLRGALAELRL